MSDVGLDFRSTVLPVLLLMLVLFVMIGILVANEIKEWIVDIRKFLRERTMEKERED